MRKILKKIITNILKFEAILILRRYKPKIIAVTGSVGKTSTKDAIYSVLSESFFVRKSLKSYNSEFGVPLTILGRESGWDSPIAWISNIFEGIGLIFLKNHYPKWLVLEVGAGKPGDIKEISSWLMPDIVVITSFGEVPAHIEFFGSKENLVKEKSYLISALKKEGLLVLNSDDYTTMGMRTKWSGEVMTYGWNPNSILVAANENIIYEDGSPSGITFRSDHDGSSVPVRLRGVVGRQHIYSALAAMSVGLYLKLNMVRMAQSLEAHIWAPGRMSIIDGIKNTYIIDDTYNASPVATEAALNTLGEINTSGTVRKVAMLGDMLELGKHAMDEHKRIGKIAGSVVDMLLVVGANARYFSQGALEGGISEKNIFEFADSRIAGKYMEQNLKEGDIILVKGSQGMRMERAVAEIMKYPNRKNELLVRQEKEWLNR